MILVNSFSKIGPEEINSSNNAFLLIIILSISFAAQIYYKPFLNKELNDFNLKANIVMIVTVFFGLFSSVCADNTLQIILLIAIILINFYFILLFFQKYLTLKIGTKDHSLKCFIKFKNVLSKSFQKGTFFF